MSIKATHVETALETVYHTLVHKRGDKRCHRLADFDTVSESIIRWGEIERNKHALHIAIMITESQRAGVGIATIIEALSHDANALFFSTGNAGYIGEASHYAWKFMQAYL